MQLTLDVYLLPHLFTPCRKQFDKENYLEHPIPAAPVVQPGQQVPPEVLPAHAAPSAGTNIATLDFPSTVETGTSCRLVTREFHTCKQEEGQSVSSYVLKMKGYIDNLERLGQLVGQNLAGLRGSKKLKPGALSLYVGDGHRAAVESIETYHLELPSRLVIVLNNCHYAPSITRGVILVLRLFDDGFINRFDDNNVISVSKNSLVYFIAVPRDGIFEIVMSCSNTNDSSIPFGDYALETAARHSNMVPQRKKVDKTPYEIWHGQAPKLSYLKIASRSVKDLELIQEEDTNPSVDTSLNHKEDDQRKLFELKVISILFNYHGNNIPMLQDVKSSSWKKFCYEDLGDALHFLLDQMTTSVGNNSVFRSFFEKQKLTGPNFIDWYRQLRLVLSTEDKEYYLEHPIPAAPVAQPRQQVPPEALAAHDAWVKGQKEVVVLMLLTMDLDIQRNLAHLGAYDMLQELKAMFSKQAEQELLQTVREFHTCKQEEGQSVSSHVLKMKGYIDNLERLGQPVGQNLAVSLILVSLNKDFTSFVQNFNMHGMGKTVNELHAMLKLHEESLPKKDANPALHAIRAGRVQKNQKNKPHKAGRGGKGKGKNKMGYAHNNVPFAPKPKTSPPPKKDNPAKDAICHQCGEVGHWRRNCPVYLTELMKKKKLPQGASTSGIFTIELYSFPSKSWIYDTGCGTHICITTQGLRGSRKLKPGALSLFVGDGHIHCLTHPNPLHQFATTRQQDPPEALAAHAAWVKGQKEVVVLMLLTMDLDIQRNLFILEASHMLHELKGYVFQTKL
ncbi:zinc finger, CCHC-type containing protein [Tanacetum coccineum]